MNVFGVGPLELAVILIVALVIVGPDRLPRLAADLARTIKEIRKYTGGLAAEFNEVVKDVERETANERTVWKDVTEGIGGATQQVTTAVREVRQDVFKAQEAAVNGTTPPPPSSADPAPAPSNGHTPAANDAWVDIAEPDAPASPPDAPEKVEQSA